MLMPYDHITFVTCARTGPTPDSICPEIACRQISSLFYKVQKSIVLSFLNSKIMFQQEISFSHFTEKSSVYLLNLR